MAPALMEGGKSAAGGLAAQQRAEQFFERYAAALLARDATAVSRLYAVPSLIVFPGRLLAVTDEGQTREFFASAWDQYEGVHEMDKQVRVIAEAPGCVWVDVTWSRRGRDQERFCYQLVDVPEGYRIAVLTPMALAPQTGERA